VPQVSPDAIGTVSPISKSAGREKWSLVQMLDGPQVWKPAIQQTWKSALRPRRLPVQEFQTRILRGISVLSGTPSPECGMAKHRV
jgi:hypothetical protein